MDEGNLAGILTEDDIIRFVFGQPDLMNSPVREAMQRSFVSVDRDLPMNALVAILQAQPYAAVMSDGCFYGLITRSDVLNSLRLQMNSTRDVA